MRILLLALGLACACEAEPKRAPLVVFAPSSQTEAFSELARLFEAEHPRAEVQLVFAGSQVLRLQIEQGAPADVFASADAVQMAALEAAGAVAPAEIFATGELALIVPAGAGAIERFEDLSAAERIVVGAPHVPVGRYTEQLFERAAESHGAAFVAALRERVVSRESNVRLVRAKVALGEADAAFVYATDARAPGVRRVPLPEGLRVRARYPIAVSARAAHPEAAARFVALVRSARGRAILERHGFGTEAR